jgi:PAS domain S-box-containing protein
MIKKNFSMILVLTVSVLLIAINFYTIRITSAVRAYINGESKYSKGQKDATHHLVIYTINGDGAHWESFLHEIEIPIGDSLARVALTQGNSTKIAKAGFLQGMNHPDDLNELIWLFTNFKEISFMHDAISIWKKADVSIGKLYTLGHEIRSSIRKGDLTILGAAARKINALLFWTDLVLIVIVIGSAGQFWAAVYKKARIANERLTKTLVYGKMGSATINYKSRGINLSTGLLQIMDLPHTASRQISLGDFLDEFVIPEDRKIVVDMLDEERQFLESQTSVNRQFRIHSRSGTVKLLNVQSFFGKTEAFAITQDITSMKKVEDEIIRSERRLKNILEGLPVAVYITDAEANIVSFNGAAARLWGRIPELMKEKWCGSYKLFTPDGMFIHRDECPMAVSIRHQVPMQNMEARLQQPTGEFVDFIAYTTPLKDASGVLAGAMNVMIDITERKHIEREITGNRNFLSTLLGNLPGFVYRAKNDLDYSIEFVSDQVESITGYKASDFISQRVKPRDLIHPDDVDYVWRTTQKAIENNTPFDIEYRLIAKGGTQRWIWEKGRGVKDATGFLLSIEGFAEDITTHKENELALSKNRQQLEELLHEKELLIQEIHHRVKNNLQVISSVLFLKAQTLKDPVMRMLLTESRQRLRSMAMIHERLMQSGGQVTQINIKEYLIGLIHEQKQALSIDPERISIDIDVEDRMMNLDQVVNIGFIINETFTNSVKHAFPVQTKGAIKVEFKQRDGCLQLKISDNGVGLPGHVTVDNTNLFGVQLVKVFANHLGANLQLDGTHGTEWIIDFH